MLTALRPIHCAQCPITVEAGGPVDLIDGQLCCEDCVLAHQWALSGL
ncbi:hypothetical protein GCM10009759_62590 [Kitasatospora saccharophila]|uniref:Uncharacterized protein n=1 Tax=Kitasatospora saccharophila TaxID=407973 RepID=A0ABP5JHX9_9ACTN